MSNSRTVLPDEPVYFSLSQNRKAISAYRRALKLAKAEGFADLRLLAARGLAQALHLLGAATNWSASAANCWTCRRRRNSKKSESSATTGSA